MVGSRREIKDLLEKSFWKIKISHQNQKKIAKKKNAWPRFSVNQLANQITALK